MKKSFDESIRQICSWKEEPESVELIFKTGGILSRKTDNVLLDYNVFSSILEGSLEDPIEEISKRDLKLEIYDGLNKVSKGSLEEIKIYLGEHERYFLADYFSGLLSHFVKGEWTDWETILSLTGPRYC